MIMMLVPQIVVVWKLDVNILLLFVNGCLAILKAVIPIMVVNIPLGYVMIMMHALLITVMQSGMYVFTLT
jgi:hypothetical protein